LYGNENIKQQVNTARKSETSAESDNDKSGGKSKSGAVTGNEKENGGKSTVGKGEINESASPKNTEPDGKIQSDVEQNKGKGKGTRVPSATNAEPSKGEAKVTTLEKQRSGEVKEVKALQNEVEKLSKALQKNLTENQKDMFGQNQTQSLFDDKALQQKVYNDKLAQLREAQQKLAETTLQLRDAKDAVGQTTLELPDSENESFDLASGGTQNGTSAPYKWQPSGPSVPFNTYASNLPRIQVDPIVFLFAHQLPSLEGSTAFPVIVSA